MLEQNIHRIGSAEHAGEQALATSGAQLVVARSVHDVYLKN